MVGNDGSLNLRSPFVQGQDSRIAIIALHREVFDISVTTVDLQRPGAKFLHHSAKPGSRYSIEKALK